MFQVMTQSPSAHESPAALAARKAPASLTAPARQSLARPTAPAHESPATPPAPSTLAASAAPATPPASAAPPAPPARKALATLAALAASLVATPSAQAAGRSPSCESLHALQLPHTTITVAEPGDVAKVIASAGLVGPVPPSNVLPPFCRVAATIAPTTDSEIKIELWMPASGWNGKLEAVGNGGWAGTINYPGLASALRHGYAAASTDTGHASKGDEAAFALGHPEKLVDFAWRAVHEMTVDAKAIVTAFYGSAPKRSYWNGCSSGGRQGLVEAQRFPDDFDGIVAGAPANDWTHLMASGVWIGQATLGNPSAYIPREKYAVIHRAAIEACDAADGVKDGLIDNPTRCRFDPAILECRAEQTDTCLTHAQVEAARKIYSGPKNPRTGDAIFPGLEPGAELGWDAMAGGPKPFPITSSHFKYVVFKDPNWDFRSLDFDRDVALADRLDAGLLTATNPDLRKYFARGGKLLLYHGWTDQLIAPRSTVDYYERAMAASGAQAAASIRLFMVPGMAHCGGGEGPNTFDAFAALERWVEDGKTPDQLPAAHKTRGVTDRTRPLCRYPQTAHYTGSGSIDDAANFVCR
jgi:feruloyl esterase